MPFHSSTLVSQARRLEQGLVYRTGNAVGIRTSGEGIKEGNLCYRKLRKPEKTE
jgi:hypothetical protein